MDRSDKLFAGGLILIGATFVLQMIASWGEYDVLRIIDRAQYGEPVAFLAVLLALLSVVIATAGFAAVGIAGRRVFGI